MKTKDEVDALFEQVKHLIDSDEPTEHPWEVQPHEFTDSQRSSLLSEFPGDVAETAAEDYLSRLALAIGTYHRLDRSNETRLSNSDARRKLAALRQAIVKTHEQFVTLPVQLHGEIDLALQHVLQSKLIEQGGESAPYVRSYTAPYSDATGNWVMSFLTRLEELASAVDLIEERRQSNRGGKLVDRAMSYLSLQSAKAYRDCFGRDPAPTEGKPFERILANLADIVGRHDNSTDGNVMHYVRKAIKDLDFVR